MFSRRRRTPFSRFIPPPPSGPSSGSGMPQSAPGRSPRGGGVPGRRPQVRPFPSPRRGSGPAPPAGRGSGRRMGSRAGWRRDREHSPGSTEAASPPFSFRAGTGAAPACTGGPGGGKGAGGGGGAERGNTPGDEGKPLLPRSRSGQGPEQPLRVRVDRVGEEVARLRDLDDAPQVHDRHPVGELRYHPEVVGDQQDRHPLLLAHLLEEGEDLG